MGKRFNISSKILLFTLLVSFSSLFYANPPLGTDSLKQGVFNNAPLITPAPPSLNATAYILIDADSGKIIAEKNSDKRVPPASLTKIMTLHVISSALKSGQISLDDTVRVSKNAWKTGGSRMFVKEGQQVPVRDLLKGIIVQSGNDACVAMAEYIGGSEKGFTELMNQQASSLNMTNSHFSDSTGLPSKDHYTTAKDLALLSQSLVQNFPEYYPWYKQKWFTFNGIRQPNRNRLLWRDGHVDGIKTGHTNEAGYCLVSSAKKDRMRLIAVVLGSPSESARADDSERLLNYGFRFFETHDLYKGNEAITRLPVFKGKTNVVPVGTNSDQYVTIPNGQYKRLSINTKINKKLIAPIAKGEKVGELIVRFDDNIISTQPLYALQEVPKGGLFKRLKDGLTLTFQQWFGS